MHHITTNRDLDRTATDPADIYDILIEHLRAQCGRGQVEWTIDTPTGPVWGSIDTHGQQPQPEELHETVYQVTTGLLWTHHRPRRTDAA